MADDGAERCFERGERRVAAAGLRQAQRQDAAFNAGDRLAILPGGERGSFATAFDENDGRYRVFGCFSNSSRAFLNVS